MRGEYRRYYALEVERSAPSRAASVLNRKSARRQVSAAVDDSVNGVVATSAVPIRDDAVLFLIVNFETLVGYPLSLEGHLGLDDLSTGIAADTKTVLEDAQAARAENSASDGGPISGHEIVDAISRSWDRLWSTTQDLWGL